MSQKSFRNYIRLVVLTFFLTSNSIGVIHGIFRLIGDSNRGQLQLGTGQMIAILFVFVLWFAVELWELKYYSYNIPSHKKRLLLFAIRVIPFGILFAAVPISMNLLLPMGVIVATFYTAVYFDRKWAIGILVCIIVAQLTVDIVFTDPFPPKRGNDGTDIFFVIYQLMNTLLVWMIAVFWRDDRKQWIQINNLNERLKHTQTRLKTYADKVADMVILEERTRMARDIHDSLGHNLTAASVQLNKAEGYLEREPDTTRQALVEVRSCLQEAMRDIRQSLSSTSNGSGKFELFQQVNKLVSRLPDEEIHIESHLEGDEAGFNKAVLLAAYRMVQEGVTNALKHASAQNLSITIVLERDHLRISLKDDGTGFDSRELFNRRRQENHNSGSGTGLIGLKDRIEILRGVLEIRSHNNQGTELVARMPREPADLVQEGEADERAKD